MKRFLMELILLPATIPFLAFRMLTGKFDWNSPTARGFRRIELGEKFPVEGEKNA